MQSDGELSADEKGDRIEALLEELHAQEHHAFLEIQFAEREAVYQSYPRNHNLTGLTADQRERFQDVLEAYDLTIIFEDSDGESTTVTAAHDDEPTATEHLSVLEDVLTDVYDVTFADATLAFLSSGGPDSTEPVLWTDIGVDGSDKLEDEGERENEGEGEDED